MIVSDDVGGAIIAWEDARNSGTSGTDIYVQRVNACGDPRWPINGVPLCTFDGEQWNPMIVSDGNHGAIVMWQDTRDPHPGIYAQHVLATGFMDTVGTYWIHGGVPLMQDGPVEMLPAIASDGNHGAYFAWSGQQYSMNVDYDIYAGHVNADGSNSFVTMCDENHDQDAPTVASDGQGGAIVTWYDYQNEPGSHIYAQPVSWGNACGNAVTTTGTQSFPKIARVGAGSVVAAWLDSRNGPSIYAQRLSGTSWTTGGVPVCTGTASHTESPQIASDGANGAIITWNDSRADIYVQRLDSSDGAPRWGTNGVALCTATGTQNNPRIVSDEAGGAILAWNDGRNGADIYAERVDSEGAAMWATNNVGVAVCDTAGTQSNPAIVSDGKHGAIVTWQDNRYGGSYDIFVRRLYSSTVLSPGAPTISVSFGNNYIQTTWTGRGDEADSGTPLRWVVYVDGDSVLGGTAHAPGVTEAATKEGFTPCTYHDVYVLVVAQDECRKAQSNTVSGLLCCTSMCDDQRSGPVGGEDRAATQDFALALGQPRPNPARDATEIRWSIPRERAGERFQIAVFDVSGRRVATVAEGNAEAGLFTAMLRPRREASLTSGAYFLRLQIGDTRLTRSLILGR